MTPARGSSPPSCAAPYPPRACETRGPGAHRPGDRIATVRGVINLRNFRHVALIEATTFLLLLVASYLKCAQDEPIGVEILGPIHGLLFIAYVVMALVLRDEHGWST